jgi:phosphoenolpyruvate-protein phosphotransferase (PTS system enzyme I)
VTATDLAGVVVVARDLMPADAIVLRHRGAAAFVTEYGGPMSHTAILARSLGIPAVVGVHNVTRYLRQGRPGGGRGVRDRAGRSRRGDPRLLPGPAGRHRDPPRPAAGPGGPPGGHPRRGDRRALANLELPEDAEAAQANGAVGVGLYRTEFLYMNREDLPDEEEHLAAYAEILRGVGGMPVTIRTLDLGVDKRLDRHPGPAAPGCATRPWGCAPSACASRSRSCSAPS